MHWSFITFSSFNIRLLRQRHGTILHAECLFICSACNSCLHARGRLGHSLSTIGRLVSSLPQYCSSPSLVKRHHQWGGGGVGHNGNKCWPGRMVGQAPFTVIPTTPITTAPPASLSEYRNQCASQGCNGRGHHCHSASTARSETTHLSPSHYRHSSGLTISFFLFTHTCMAMPMLR